MKRIHLFEFTDFAWLPEVLRRCITRLIIVMHDLLGTSEKMAGLVAKALKTSGTSTIVDLCSGSGGPMPEILKLLHGEHDMQNISLVLTDLYPDLETAEIINKRDDNHIKYLTDPLDATQALTSMHGVHTLVGSFHHMKPEDAGNILANAQVSREPICIFEISDNSTPIWLWWITFPINFFMTFFITPMVRPLTWQQLVFTYLIPVIPLCFGWDGAVSNARTYTLSDLEELLGNLESDNYQWEKGIIEGKTRQIYLLGYPDSE